MDEPRPQPATYEDLAKMIEHSVLRPDLSEEAVAEGCAIAKQYRIAAVMVRPCDADLAVRLMADSGIPVASIVSYPHGAATTSTKLYEARDLLRRGVKEIDTVINIGKMISRQFQYVETELQQLVGACHDGVAIIKVALENAYLSQDLKTIACKICKRTGVDYARTSTPYGPGEFTIDDIALMRRLCGDKVKIKASGGVRTLANVVEAWQAGCSRVGTTLTVTILESWKSDLAKRTAG